MFAPEPFHAALQPGYARGGRRDGAGWVSGSCFLARRVAMEELGGFDEAYFMYNEDMDLCWRAHDAGWGVGFAGTAEVTHVQGAARRGTPTDDGCPPPLRAPLHLPDDQGLAPCCTAPGGVWSGGAHGHRHAPHRRQPLARWAATGTAHRRDRGDRNHRAGARPGSGPRAGLVQGSGPRGAAGDVRPATRCHGCHGATRTRPAGRSATDGERRAGQVAEMADVCIGGEGPYPFILDTGAGQSTIDAGLAHRLHLASAGARPSSPVSGAPAPRSPSRWTRGRSTGSPSSGQQLTAATLPQMGGKGEPDGLLGSDVLSRFGAIRVDFVGAGTLILPGPEGAPLTQSSPFTGPQGVPPARSCRGRPGRRCPSRSRRCPTMCR